MGPVIAAALSLCFAPFFFFSVLFRVQTSTSHISALAATSLTCVCTRCAKVGLREPLRGGGDGTGSDVTRKRGKRRRMINDHTGGAFVRVVWPKGDKTLLFYLRMCSCIKFVLITFSWLSLMISVLSNHWALPPSPRSNTEWPRGPPNRSSSNQHLTDVASLAQRVRDYFSFLPQ